MVAHNPPSVLSVEQGNSNVNSLPEFSLTRAPRVTPHSLLLPEASSRYKALKEKEGSIIEISSDSLTIVENITSRISNSQRGAALIIDYGPSDTIPINSLRAIRSHRHVSPFYRPGDCDLSVDVDFRALAEHAITTYEDVEVHGPIEQGTFLTLLGIKQRMDAIAAVTQNEEKKKLIEKGYNRLIERGGGSMGKIYKAMAIVPERGGQKPVGFGGDLEPLE
jgi:NADH dehydrogenase [ubiquinone] 1 alpha subcomplex assembly factor 7